MYPELEAAIKKCAKERDIPLSEFEKCVQVSVQMGPNCLIFGLSGEIRTGIEEQVTTREEYDSIFFNHI